MSIGKLKEKLNSSHKVEDSQLLWRRGVKHYLGDTRISQERYSSLREERGSGSRVKFVFER